MRHFTSATRELLGDLGALERPDAFKPGEKQFVVSGALFIAPSRDHMILFADNFGQRHARISVTDSRPGHTVQTRQAAVVPEHRCRSDLPPDTRAPAAPAARSGAGDAAGRGDRHAANTAAQCPPLFRREPGDMRAQKLFAAWPRQYGWALGGPALVASAGRGLVAWPGTTSTALAARRLSWWHRQRKAGPYRYLSISV